MAKVKVRRNNEILRIEDYLVQSFVDNGYDVIDEQGNVLIKAIPTDPVQLKAEYLRLTKEVEELKAQLAKAQEKPAPKRTKKSDEQ